MAFRTESRGYEKTILSDPQGAWTLLRESVVETEGFEGWDRVLFQIDEAMSWESVRNLDQMPSLLLIVRNLCLHGGAPRVVMENIEELHDTLHEVLKVGVKEVYEYSPRLADKVGLDSSLGVRELAKRLKCVIQPA